MVSPARLSRIPWRARVETWRSSANPHPNCLSFKPNSTNIVVQGLACNGSHGISVGSLGQYPAQYDIVENIYIFNNSMANASDGARIKVWPGINSDFQPILNGGGGAGYVRNVTYEQYYQENNDWAIEVNQCYGQSNQTLCQLYPVCQARICHHKIHTFPLSPSR